MSITMDLGSILNETFKLKQFRKGQQAVLEDVLAKKDCIVVMPTGGGKSLCYQLPAVAAKGMVIVISPLISLMQDQVRTLRELGIPAGCLHSNMLYAEKKEVFQALNESREYILYLSPERVQKQGFAKWVVDKKPLLFAIDEAHCISQWGHDFREDYNRLNLLKEICPQTPVLALTATATPQVATDIGYRLKLKSPVRHVHGFYRPNLYYQVIQCESDFEKEQHLVEAIERYPTGRIIIYCGTRKMAESVSEFLSDRYAEVAYYHAGLEGPLRKKIQTDFDQRNTRILCATNAFGMGIDHPDVRLIVHHQMPANIESYYQEIGRAGRDGKFSTCVLLFSRKDKGLQSYFIHKSEAPKSVLNYRWRALDAIVQYAEGGDCRHGGILTYFRDSQRLSRCEHCDICQPQSERGLPLSLKPVFQKKIIVRKKKKPIKPPETELTLDVKNRMKTLREWRLQYAKEKDLPAFIIFSDKTLRDLAEKMPEDESSLLNVYGIGEHKVEEFGHSLLQVIRSL